MRARRATSRLCKSRWRRPSRLTAGTGLHHRGGGAPRGGAGARASEAANAGAGLMCPTGRPKAQASVRNSLHRTPSVGATRQSARSPAVAVVRPHHVAGCRAGRGARTSSRRLRCVLKNGGLAGNERWTSRSRAPPCRVRVAPLRARHTRVCTIRAVRLAVAHCFPYPFAEFACHQ